MGHRNICCDGCQRVEFRGRRFRCMRCTNYDLCGDCYDQRIETQAHSIEHPMQLIPEPGQEQELQLGSDMLELVHLSNCYTCPYCGLFGCTAKQLIKHVYDQHRLSEGYVACPMCASLPAIELLAIRNLSRHLLLNHIDQANQLEPDTPPLRRILTRSLQRIRRRRQQPQPQPLSRESPAVLAIEDVALPSEPQDREENEENFGAGEEPSPSRLSEGYLLKKWVAEQERLCRDAEKSVIKRHRHALFAEHLLLSMLSAEELQLPEKKRPEREWKPKRQQRLSTVMSLMSLPWTKLRQVSQWEDKRFQSSTEGELEVAALRDQTAWLERAKAGTEEEEAID
ncbi:hypothetical protein KR038_000202 [Drosophila bunnanda]|nr:hypothetical protein KR038_000202 [Drosophila bunnanda]